MRTSLALVALLFTSSAALAFDEQEAAQKLKLAADRVRSGDSEITAKSPDGKKTVNVSREEALSGLYDDLAALNYRQAGEEGKQGLKALEGKSVYASKDAAAVAVDAKGLTESGCWTCHCSIFGGCMYCCDAVAAVRGGRKINNGLDDQLASLDTQVNEVSRGFMPRSAAAYRAEPYIRAGRLYSEMADAARKAVPAADNKAQAPAPAAPAAPAAVEFSPKRIYQQAGPSVVLLICTGKDGQGELGTGSVIDGQGHVLTNAHVTIDAKSGEPYAQIRVYLKPAKVTGDPHVDLADPRSARVVKYDRALDLALLQVEDLPKVKPLSLGDSERIDAGEPVVAIGHPEQGGLWTLTTGVVSTVLANLGGVAGKDVFQTDASINRGNSGGPLLDRFGDQIGVNTSMARKAADGLTITSVNFSIKASVVKKWIGSDAAVAMNEPPADVPQPPAAAAPEVPAPAAPAAPAAAAPAAPKAEPAKPQPQVKPAPIAAKPVIVTPPQPYKIEDLIQKEISQMEDMEKEMQGEIDKRRGELNAR